MARAYLCPSCNMAWKEPQLSTIEGEEPGEKDQCVRSLITRPAGLFAKSKTMEKQEERRGGRCSLYFFLLAFYVFNGSELAS